MDWLRLIRPVFHITPYLLFMAGGTPLAATGHLTDSDCASCHSAGAAVSLHNAHLLTASQEVLCSHCHENSLLVSHPSGFTPNRLLPIQYPLDRDGILTCSSCHSIHASDPGLLRDDATGQALCLSCHEAGFFNQMADAGLSIVEMHLTLQSMNSEVALDSYSLHCMGCHDDNLSLGDDGTLLGTMSPSGSLSLNHPIGIKYEHLAGQSRYHNSTELDPRMLLPHDLVSCITCHQGYTGTHGALHLSNSSSSLCFQCHNI